VEVAAKKMYVPITEADKVEGLIHLTRKGDSHPFSRRDMGLAVAVSHQAALTLSRIHILEKSREHERIRTLLLRFVSPIEAEFLLKDYLSSGTLPGLTEQKVTVLFCDIENSTSIAERLGSKPFAALLTRYYHDVTNIVFRYGGVIKYIGDGIMATFLSTSAQTVVPQEVRAVEAGLRILARIKQPDYVFDDEHLTIGIAVNTGTAMVGYIGVGERAEFNVAGDTVNIASRMESFARPNRLLVGKSTMQTIEGKFPVRPIGEIDMRGRSLPVQIYEVASR
jgi:adenylate cyclase